MSRYTAGWTWQDEATEEQIESNKEACDVTYGHIRQLYDQVPDPASDFDNERRAEALDAAFEREVENAEERGLSRTAAYKAAEDALKKQQALRAAETKLLWDQIEFFEEKLHDLGARLRRPYEHHNEDEKLMAFLEGE